MMIGVLLHYYGSPRTPADVADYYESIIHRRPTAEQVTKLSNSYRAYGRPSPLGSTVERLQLLLENRLNQGDECQFIVERVGKHSPPSVPDVVASMRDRGVTRFVSFPLTPFGSRLGTSNYHRAVRRALTDLTGADSDVSLPVIPVERWYAHDLFVRACSLRLTQAMNWLEDDVQDQAMVVFTTHSMPKDERQTDLSIHEQYSIWAEKVAEKSAVAQWKLSYRSAPGGEDKWLGPDILDVIHDVALDGKKAVIVCPLPTLIENIEVFEEAGSDARSVANDVKLQFVRTELLNDAADMLDLLEQLVRSAVNT